MQIFSCLTQLNKRSQYKKLEILHNSPLKFQTFFLLNLELSKDLLYARFTLSNVKKSCENLLNPGKQELAIVRILGGPAAGKEFPLFDTNISLGRSKESDLIIGDTLLSRKHARIIFKEEKWYIEDLKSSNGTWIGAKQIIEIHEIENYQRIRAGN